MQFWNIYLSQVKIACIDAYLKTSTFLYLKLNESPQMSQQGSARRKKKVVHRTATADDKKLQFSLKKLGVNNISGIEEVCCFCFSRNLSRIFFNTIMWVTDVSFICCRLTCLQIKERSSTSTTPKCRPPLQQTPSLSLATLRPNSWPRCCQASWTSLEPTAWRASGDSPRLCPNRVSDPD